MSQPDRPSQQPDKVRERIRRARWTQLGQTPSVRCQVCGDLFVGTRGRDIHESKMHRGEK